MGLNVDAKTTKMCVFCKYWDDPTHEHCSPSGPNHWNIEDPYSRELCLANRHETYANQTACSKFSRRIIFYK